MSVNLIWRPAGVPSYKPNDIPADAPLILTSLTAHEAIALQELAANGYVLEIGSAYGYSTITMALSARHVLAVDYHAAYVNGLEIMQHNLRAYGVQSRVTCLVGESAELLPRIKASFDLVFIDGSHEYADVLKDIWQSRPLVRPGGAIACHDYDEDTCPKVKQAIVASGIGGAVMCDTLWVERLGRSE